jgi:hypothetical protein
MFGNQSMADNFAAGEQLLLIEGDTASGSQ